MNVVSCKIPQSPPVQTKIHVSHCIELCSTKGLDHGTSHLLIILVWLHHQDNTDSKVKVYALLDEQSDACFMKESTLNTIAVDGPDVQ